MVNTNAAELDDVGCGVSTLDPDALYTHLKRKPKKKLKRKPL